MTLEGSDNDDSGPYGPIGINASGGDGSHANLGWENEVESEDLSNGKDIDYLDSSDVGSYETNSNGDFISKKIVKVYQQEDQATPSMSTQPVTPMPRQAALPMVFISIPSTQSFSAFGQSIMPYST
ncbi:hypothetical protein V6N13_104851 [Hibiscus sabdariffa]